jgi:3-hydroxyisobutyrate dehydrogenase
MTSEPDAPLVGFIGLGQLGGLVARHLLSWRGGLVVCDVNPDALTPFVERGATRAADPAEVIAHGASVVCLMVRDDEQVTAVVRALLPDAPEGTVVAIHSTIRPQTAVDLAAEAAARGVVVLDAPVTGGPSGAREGTLAVMVGGPDAAVDRCREPFACFSDRVVQFGDVGAATRAKIARNLITFAGYVAAGEAQRLAAASGVDLVKLGGVVRYSDTVTGGAGTIMLRDTIEPIDPTDPWFDIMSHTRDLGDKDLQLAEELARELGVEVPLTALARTELDRALGVPPADQQTREET